MNSIAVYPLRAKNQFHVPKEIIMVRIAISNNQNTENNEV